MKENELRVGNIVHNGVVREQEIYDSSYIELAQFYEPVPLTEELLLRFGAVKKGIYLDFHLLSLLKTKTGRFEVYLDEAWELTTIDYVHEWQNLYYAINKTELTLKDKAE